LIVDQHGSREEMYLVRQCESLGSVAVGNRGSRKVVVETLRSWGCWVTVERQWSTVAEGQNVDQIGSGPKCRLAAA
jgi:hypothetical protein